ncbi:DUF4175 domain-containing protein [Woodsholea maritima]|uniref:DUF4175 domain-containing protein n=1 Tax=Woodsholea maritima TaxID=240237 RepID=UPI00037E7F0E|nr:DUF4175 family protein [Woodsholea maritima]
MRYTTWHKARLALIWERSAPVLIGPAAVLALYCALALFGVFEALGDPARALSAMALLLVAGMLARWQAKHFHWPSARDIEARIEEDSGFTDRPFEAVRDVVASGDEALFSRHRQRMAARLKTATAHRPKAAWARLDHYGLRLCAAILLVFAFISAGDLARLRLEDAFALRVLDSGGVRPSLDIWAEPPTYTRRAPIYARGSDLNAPEGSRIAVRIAGYSRQPDVRFRGQRLSAEPLEGDVWQAYARLDQGGDLDIRAGSLRQSLPVSMIEDENPHLTLVAEPDSDSEGVLILDFRAEDDYAIEHYHLHLRPANTADKPSQDWDKIEIAPGSVTSRGEEGYRARIDVSRHFLAGERVDIRLAGTDGADQTGITPPLTIVLPERVFLVGLAKAIAEQRRTLMGVKTDYAPLEEREALSVHDLQAVTYLDDEPERRIERAPHDIQHIALALEAITDSPSRYYQDPILYMGLRTSLRQIQRARERDTLAPLEEDFWQMALRAELGSLADAEAALRQAEQALLDAFARGADAMELSALFDAYERAMSRYIAALAREAQQGEGGQGSANMGSDALQQMLDALRDSAELGDTPNARRALQALSEMLRNMQVTLGQGQGGEESEMERALREALEELGDMIGQQRGVMNDTFNRQDEREREDNANGEDDIGPRREQQDGINPDGEGEDGLNRTPAEDLAERQALLEEALEGLGGGLDDEAAEDALGAAQDAMDDAARALSEGDFDRALEAQDEALSALRRGAARTAQRLLEESGDQEDGQGQQYDPAGRPINGDGSDTRVPSEAQRQRARDILEELRRRRSEPDRPREELDYLDRLLEQF